ncbi:MAG TPA: hypothetical protein VMP68_16315 [Candidatus Eisenbacteria bacterium]|nr:hypothetical protein [Candidatus Eisenbacteria bacterium]
MLAKCANPACSTRFRYLESGTLFRLENEARSSSDQAFREYFWLCGGCSSGLTLRLNAAGRLRVVEGGPLPQRRDNDLDFVVLDRQHGMQLSRVTLLRRTGRRHENTEGGLVYA